jgi:signal peptidase I
MAKTKSLGTKPRSPSSASASQSDKPSSELDSGLHRHLPSPAAIRETVESVVIAFVLAFLFRTFEAEAFVIPTGSMAPTLMGRHKDMVCPKCHYPYQVSASEEVTQDGERKDEGSDVVSGTCPMCRYTARLEKETSFNGDRILVSKFAYQIAEPQREDIVVFRYPCSDGMNDARTNFIKRLVGLPGDTIRIQNGDVWVKSDEDKKKHGDAAQFVIARRPPKKLLAMLQPVFDNDYMPQIASFGWPVRWYADSDSPAAAHAAGAWRSDDLATFLIDGTAREEQWLRYRHRVPSYGQWQQIDRAVTPVPEPQLITDFIAYDSGKIRSHAFVGRAPPDIAKVGPDPDGVVLHWVGDLAVACTVDVQSPDGTLIFELRKAGQRFQCRFELATGKATLSIAPGSKDVAEWQPTASTAVRGKGRHTILFSNCDDELRLWVDGELVSFDRATTYPNLGNTRPDAADLAPVGVASLRASVQISHLRVLRDIYYLADRWNTNSHDVWYRAGSALPQKEESPQELPEFVDFELGKEQFFVLGDNSPMSRDARVWGRECAGHGYSVPRDLLIGKALFIYWPHSWDRLPYFNSIPCPYFPNFSRMGLVR